MRWFVAAVVLCLVAQAAFAYTTEQAAKGKQDFATSCADCHGSKGQGGTVPSKFSSLAGMKAPALAGKGALSNLKTAGGLYDFIKTQMPLNSPGSLSKDQYLDITAYLVQANHAVKADGKPLTEQNASQIKLP